MKTICNCSYVRVDCVDIGFHFIYVMFDDSVGKQLLILLKRRVRSCRGQLRLLLIPMAVRQSMVKPAQTFYRK